MYGEVFLDPQTRCHRTWQEVVSKLRQLAGLRRRWHLAGLQVVLLMKMQLGTEGLLRARGISETGERGPIELAHAVASVLHRARAVARRLHHYALELAIPC